MSILNEAQLDNSKLKMAIRGASGSGKTFVATAIAVGLQNYIGSKKPIAFWDTENALSYVLPHFKHNGITVMELKARAFKLVNDFFDEAEATCDIAVLDSMTHIRDEMIEAFKARKHKEKLAVWDYGILTPEFNKVFLDRIVNSPLHIIGCGRLSDIYEYIEVDGAKVLTTTGSKMRAGRDTEYEFSLTVELERFTMSDEELQTAARATKAGMPNSKLINKAAKFYMTIIKDRANVLAGRYEFESHQGEFVEPDNEIWTAVKPFCDALNIGGGHKGVNLKINSNNIFDSPDTSWQERERQKTILLEEVEAEMKVRFGQSKEDKSAGIALLKEAFGTPSWTAIQGMTIDKVRVGHGRIVPPPVIATLPAPEITTPPIRDFDGLVGKIAKDLTYENRIDELQEKLESIEPNELDSKGSKVRWTDFYGMPAQDITPDMVVKVANKIGYSLTGDTGGVSTLIKEGKYLKAALEKMEAWDKKERAK
jgi:hypothetical protein